MTQTVLLGDVAEKIAMGPFGSNIKVSTFVESGIPVISGQHLKGVTVDDSEGYNYITTDHADKLKNSNVLRGDVVFTHAGNIGQVAYIPKNSRFDRYVLSQRQFYLRPSKKLSAKYLTYYFKSPKGASQLLEFANQTGVPSLSQPATNLKKIRIDLPDIEEQKKIANILGTIDEKIELNRKMNETLEQMGQALFRRYFIDNPEADKWVKRPLSEQIEILSGGTPKTSESSYWGGDIPWFSVVDAPSGSDLFTIKTAKNITDEGLKNSAAKIIMQYSTIISARGTVGKLAIAGREMTINQSCYALQSDTPLYTYQVINHCLSAIKSRVHGSVFDTITRDTFSQLKFAVPPESTVQEFEKKTQPLFYQILGNVQQTQKLINLRDTLLPRLISGKVKV